MNNQLAQEILIKWGLLSPPADGIWGPQSQAALEAFQAFHGLSIGKLDAESSTALEISEPPELVLTIDLASKIIRYMLQEGYFISRGVRRYNIVYLEGCDQNGTPNDDRFNEWNDRRILIEIPGFKQPMVVGNWIATTEPGATYTYKPMNSGGAFRIAFGQYRAWKFGFHGRTQYPALVQCGNVSGYRDKNQDGFRTGDPFVTGDEFGVNQHHGWDMEIINEASAGCLVGKTIEGHQTFMGLLRNDRRYQVNSNYIWHTAILDASRLT